VDAAIPFEGDVEASDELEDADVGALRRQDDQAVGALIRKDLADPGTAASGADGGRVIVVRAPGPPPPGRRPRPGASGRAVAPGGGAAAAPAAFPHRKDLGEPVGDLAGVRVVDRFDPDLLPGAGQVDGFQDPEHPPDVAARVRQDEGVRRRVGGDVALRRLEAGQQRRGVVGADVVHLVEPGEVPVSPGGGALPRVGGDGLAFDPAGLDDLKIAPGGHDGHPVELQDGQEGLVGLGGGHLRRGEDARFDAPDLPREDEAAAGDRADEPDQVGQVRVFQVEGDPGTGRRGPVVDAALEGFDLRRELSLSRAVVVATSPLLVRLGPAGTDRGDLLGVVATALEQLAPAFSGPLDRRRDARVVPDLVPARGHPDRVLVRVVFFVVSLLGVGQSKAGHHDREGSDEQGDGGPKSHAGRLTECCSRGSSPRRGGRR